jgi:very-short-patch-repair endonuclease
MRPQPSKRSPDSIINELAMRQKGVVYREQLLSAGVTTGEIRTRLTWGRLIELHRGVYLVGAVAPQFAYEQAALFACRPGAILSHLTAASIWHLRSYGKGAPIWVTVPHSRRPRRRNVIVRRAEVLPADIRSRKGLRLTSPPRTVLDCAAVLDDPYELEALVAEANFRRLASDLEMDDQLARNRNRPGVPALREIVSLPGGPQRTRSPGERAFLKLLRCEGFAGFEANAEIYGWEVDFLWRDLNFGVELDGWDGHSGRTAFEKDRLKWAELEARKITLMPITGRQMQRDKLGVVRRLRAALAARGPDVWRHDVA